MQNKQLKFHPVSQINTQKYPWISSVILLSALEVRRPTIQIGLYRTLWSMY